MTPEQKPAAETASLGARLWATNINKQLCREAADRLSQQRRTITALAGALEWYANYKKQCDSPVILEDGTTFTSALHHDQGGRARKALSDFRAEIEETSHRTYARAALAAALAVLREPTGKINSLLVDVYQGSLEPQDAWTTMIDARIAELDALAEGKK